MILSEKDLLGLCKDTKTELLDILYKIEDELCYDNKDVTETIDWLQINDR